MWILTPEQKSLYQETLRFARSLNYDIPAAEESGMFPREVWRQCAEFGLLAIPGEGDAPDVLTTLVAYEAFGRGCRDNGLAFSLSGQLFSCQMPIHTHASPAVKEKYMPGLVSGELIAAHGSSEPGAGSDVGMVKTTAKKVEGGWRINGSKTFSSMAPASALAVVLAKVEGESYSCEFVVPRDQYQVSAPFKKIGLKTSPMGELILEDAFVPDDHVLGKPGTGMLNFMTTMEWERLGIVAATVGMMERQLEECIDHAKNRVQFGVPVGAFQAVSHRLVEMKRRLETSRLIMYAAGAKKQATGRATLEVSLAKLHVSESQVANSLDAVRTFGAYGCMAESGVERDLRDAVPALIYSGTSDIQRNTIARLLGLPASVKGT